MVQNIPSPGAMSAPDFTDIYTHLWLSRHRCIIAEPEVAKHVSVGTAFRLSRDDDIHR